MNKIAGMKDCVEALAMKKGVTKVEAQNMINDVLEVIADKCKDGGVSFKGLFTIKQKVQKGRTGKCSFNGKEWKTEDKIVLSISVGAELENELNNR